MRNDDGLIGLVIIGALVGFALLTGMAHWANLDRDSFLHLALNLVGWLCIVGGAWYYFGGRTVRQWWPAAVAALWLCFWPALTYWGVAHIGSEGGLLTESTLQEIGERAFWSMGMFKLAVAAGILGAGFAFDPEARPFS